MIGPALGCPELVLPTPVLSFPLPVYLPCADVSGAVGSAFAIGGAPASADFVAVAGEPFFAGCVLLLDMPSLGL